MTDSQQGTMYAIEIQPAEDCNFFLLTPLGQPHNESMLNIGAEQIYRKNTKNTQPKILLNILLRSWAKVV